MSKYILFDHILRCTINHFKVKANLLVIFACCQFRVRKLFKRPTEMSKYTLFDFIFIRRTTNHFEEKANWFV